MTKPRAPLAPGTKIRFVGPSIKGGRVWHEDPRGLVATVKFNLQNDMLHIQRYAGNKDDFSTIHRRQIVSVLKPRPPVEKRERVERWLAKCRGYECAYLMEDNAKNSEGLVSTHHLIEVRPGELITSEADLAKAWNSVFNAMKHNDKGSAFPSLVEAIKKGGGK